ncbi:alpha/beta fold hydrolase [Rhizobium sp. NZLR8]|uniref:dienelactone hydrolase family protein n=1 Tax=Rhizobium sp. NZLR8 TaxID=2731104 RepID=UPI001C83F35F|nr:alpha/beta fold hydrolase [Rhizobium sp. NZLR8]MBX5157676.1 alpha/beta fold hydrolase [Rhizobium sp. NZLR8]
MSSMTEFDFDYEASGKHYKGLLLKSATLEPKAAIALLPDWRGQSPLARDHAAHLVTLGCAAVIADLYGDGFSPDSPDQVAPMVKNLIDHRDQGVAALAACVERLRQEVPAGTPILCLGYSAGGMVALDYGRCGADVAGIVLCSALLKTAAEGMDTRVSPPVLILQGTQDQVSSMETIAEIIAEMDRAGNDVRFELYTQTHHAFDNPEAGTDPNPRLVYSPTSARRAKTAIASFLTEVIERS